MGQTATPTRHNRTITGYGKEKRKISVTNF
jgi:hypothetical protein